MPTIDAETTNQYKKGHEMNIREEIISYLDEYFNESGKQRPSNIDAYISAQTAIVLDRLYNGVNLFEEHPNDIDPNNIVMDYYREAICEFGDVYTTYMLDDM
jgi:hypothetical protein